MKFKAFHTSATGVDVWNQRWNIQRKLRRVKGEIAVHDVAAKAPKL
jgi:hypothetical protein